LFPWLEKCHYLHIDKPIFFCSNSCWWVLFKECILDPCTLLWDWNLYFVLCICTATFCLGLTLPTFFEIEINTLYCAFAGQRFVLVWHYKLLNVLSHSPHQMVKLLLLVTVTIHPFLYISLNR
jgi:hypothetical protein